MSTEHKTVTPDTLNSVMEFDHVIQVHPDGSVTDEWDLLEPSLVMHVDADGQDMYGDAELIRQAASNRYSWQLLSGFTGQYGYNGVVFHQSEFIGGGLARHILETPGYYVALVVEVDCGYVEEFCTEESGCDCFPAGWAVAYKPLEG